jgi:short-subunit dehydrogenase
MRRPRRIVITGASSGIGEALALAYAAPGVGVALSGRDAERLEAVALRCRERGAAAEAAVVDVADRAAMADWLARLDAAGAIDLAIANAGVDGTAFAPEERLRGIFRINVDGAINTVEPALALMLPRRRGQIALMASLAGFVGMPGAAAYGASKAAVRVLGEGLRGRHAADGIEISVICPGFVRTRMTFDNRFPMPFLWEADRAAARIVRGLARNEGRIAFPWPMYLGVRALQLLPQALLQRALARVPRKT